MIVVIFAFNSGNNVASFAGFSTKWFKAALQDDSITSAITRSLQIAFASAIVATVFGTAAALALARAAGGGATRSTCWSFSRSWCPSWSSRSPR